MIWLLRRSSTYLAGFDNNQAAFAAHWHFLTDYADNAKKLADQVGFHYKWDARQQNFAHTAAIMFLSSIGQDLPVPVRHQIQAAGRAAGVNRSE